MAERSKSESSSASQHSLACCCYIAMLMQAPVGRRAASRGTKQRILCASNVARKCKCACSPCTNSRQPEGLSGSSRSSAWHWCSLDADSQRPSIVFHSKWSGSACKSVTRVQSKSGSNQLVRLAQHRRRREGASLCRCRSSQAEPSKTSNLWIKNKTSNSGPN